MLSNIKLIWKCIIGIAISLLLVWILSFNLEIAPFQKQVYSIHKFSLLESKYLYILHHIICFVPVFILSISLPWFTSRTEFIGRWYISIIIGSVLFCIWDLVFTKLQIWNFNDRHIIGLNIGGFPLEEILWFPVIAYCSLLIHHLLVKRAELLKPAYYFSYWILLFQILGAFIFRDRIYTAFSSWAVISLIAYMILSQNHDLLARFSRSFFIILIPMILADGLLTGMFTDEPVVIYNPMEFSGIRIFSIPIEDFSFGYAFIGIIIAIENCITKTKSVS